MNNAQARYQRVLSVWSDIKSHLPTLYQNAHGDVLELGVRSGNSTAALLGGVNAHGGRLYSVDIDASCADVFIDEPQWTFIRADSCDEAVIVAGGIPASLDVLFIDTDHTYSQMKKELDVWVPYLKPGSKLFAHDTTTYPEVYRAIQKHFYGKNAVIYNHFGSNGMAEVLIK